jgi:carbonic anhydrase/acetyltransferase-like protein (isoleucine patch superfamily)
MLLPYRGRTPQVDPSVYVQSTARVVGDVVIGPQSSLWFQVVVRGDVNSVRIGARSNVQDLSVIHVTRDRYPTRIGDDVTIGHRAVVHGCTVGDRCLIGIGAIVMDGVVIEDDCLIGAGSLVTPRTRIPSGHLAMGQPAKAVRELRPDELDYLKRSAANYVEYAVEYRNGGVL